MSRADKGAKRPRGRCFICGYERALYRSGTIYRHFAVSMCGQVEGRHNHEACRARFGVTCVALHASGEIPLCPGAGQLPGPMWLVNIWPERGSVVCHLASPNRFPHEPPLVQQRLVYPNDAAGRWANHPVSWRTICRPRLNQTGPGVTAVSRCTDDPPLVELAQITCESCTRWAANTKRRYLPVLA